MNTMKKMAKQLLAATTILAAAAACETSPTGLPSGHEAPFPGEWEPVGGGSPDTVLIDGGRAWGPSVHLEIEPSARTRVDAPTPRGGPAGSADFQAR